MKEIKTLGERLLKKIQYLNSSGDQMWNLLKENFDDRNAFGDPAAYVEYIPFDDEKMLDIVKKKLNEGKNVHDDIIPEVMTYVALIVWRKYKKIYKIDEDLLETLNAQADNMNESMNIPSYILKKLPFESFIVEAKITDISKYFLVRSFDTDTKGESGVEIIEFDNNDIGRYDDRIMLIDGKTFAEAQQIIHDRINDQLETRTNFSINTATKRILNMLLYIVAANSEIEVSKKTASTYKPRNDNQIKDKYSEVQEFNVGVNIGKALRLHTVREYYEYDEKHHTDKKLAPHVRAAHWHHYWTGPKNYPENRELILKWISPITVNGYSDDTMISSATPTE